MYFSFYLLLIYQVIVVSSIDCPKTLEWTTYNNSCLKLIVKAASWKQASSECLLSSGRLMNITKNDQKFYKLLRESNGGDNKQAQGDIWIGAHVPPLVHNSYFDQCPEGFVFKRNKCFKVQKDTYNWKQAVQKCYEMGGRIATVENDDFLKYISQIAKNASKANTSTEYWINGQIKHSELVDEKKKKLLYPTINKNLNKNSCISITGKTNIKNIYNLKNCLEKKSSICEFSLEPQKLRKTPKDVFTEYKEISPSYVGSCNEIAVLSSLALEISSNNNRQQHLQKLYAKLKNGYYILLPKSSSLNLNAEQNYNTKFNGNYRLEYCKFDSTRKLLVKSSRESILSVYLMMYKWSNYKSKELKLEVSAGNLKSYNQLQTSTKFYGACISSNLQGVWKTTPCNQEYAFVCQYHQPEAWKDFKISYPNELEVYKAYIENEMYQLQNANNSVVNDIIKNVEDTIKQLCVSIKSSKRNWKSFKSMDIINLLITAIEIMERIQNKISSSDIDSMIFVEAVSLLSELTATSCMKTKNNVTNVKTRSNDNSLVRIRTDIDEENVTINFYSNTSVVRIHIYEKPSLNKNDEVLTFRYQPNSDSSMIELKLDPNSLENVTSLAVVFASFSFKSNKETVDVQKTNSIWSIENNFKKSVMKKSWSYYDDMPLKWKLNSPIISSSAYSVSRKIQPLHVRYQLPLFYKSMNELVGNMSCVYMMYSEAIKWSDTGCWVSSSYNNNTNMIECSCNHTTDFSILLLYQPYNQNLVNNRKYLFYFGFLGELISVICLFVCIIVYSTLKRKLKNDRLTIHTNLMTSLAIAHTTLLVTQVTWLVFESTLDDGICHVFTFTLHFTLLSCMGWMFVEGLVLYKKILVVLKRDSDQKSYLYMFIGWILPIILSSICICTSKIFGLKYTSNRCWLGKEDNVIWFFIGPVCVVLTFNFLIMCKVLYVLARTQRKKIISKNAPVNITSNNQKPSTTYLVGRGVLILTPILGIPWILGLFSNGSVIVSYFFVGFTSYQGVQIIIFYLFMSPEIRAAWDEKRKGHKKTHIKDPFVKMAKKDFKNNFKHDINEFTRTACKNIWSRILRLVSTSSVNKRISSTSSQLTNITTISNKIEKIDDKNVYNKINKLSPNKLNKSERKEIKINVNTEVIEKSNSKKLSNFYDCKENILDNGVSLVKEQIALHVKQFSKTTTNLEFNQSSVDFDQINPKFVSVKKENVCKRMKDKKIIQLKLGEKRKCRKRRRKQWSSKNEKVNKLTKSFAYRTEKIKNKRKLKKSSRKICFENKNKFEKKAVCTPKLRFNSRVTPQSSTSWSTISSTTSLKKYQENTTSNTKFFDINQPKKNISQNTISIFERPTSSESRDSGISITRSVSNFSNT